MEAVELAASAGLVLDPWQADCLTDALGEGADGKWSAMEVGLIVARQNGKGSILEARALAGLLLFGSRLVMWTAHELKTAKEAFRRVEDLFANSDDLRRRVKRVIHTNGEEGIELLSGARLRFLARSKGSGRGFSGDDVFLDEAYALTEEQRDALMPTLSARPNPQIWYTSSPPLDAVSGEPLFTVKDRGEQGAAGLCWLDFGAEGHLEDLSKIDLDDRALWAATNPALGYRIPESFVERERAAMTPRGFARERLGVWPLRASGRRWMVFPEAVWKARFDPSSTPQDPVAFSIDVNPTRSHAAIGVAGKRADGDMHAELIEYREGTNWVAQRAKALKQRWTTCAFAVDPTGPAGSLIPQLAEAGIEVFEINTRRCAQAFGLMYDGIMGQPPNLPEDTEQETDTADSPGGTEGDEAPPSAPIWWRCSDDLVAPLSAAVEGAEKRPMSGALAWGKTGMTDICPIVAVTNAVYAHAACAPSAGGATPAFAFV